MQYPVGQRIVCVPRDKAASKRFEWMLQQLASTPISPTEIYGVRLDCSEWVVSEFLCVRRTHRLFHGDACSPLYRARASGAVGKSISFYRISLKRSS
jgi:hypothetical protein